VNANDYPEYSVFIFNIEWAHLIFIQEVEDNETHLQSCTVTSNTVQLASIVRFSEWQNCTEELYILY
jgi:hypothetical protein